VLDRPSDLVVTGAGIIVGCEFAGAGGVYRGPEGVLRLVWVCQGVDVSARRRDPRGARGGGGSRITDLARRGESRQGQGTQSRCPLPASRKDANAVDRLARTGVRRSFRLE